MRGSHERIDTRKECVETRMSVTTVNSVAERNGVGPAKFTTAYEHVTAVLSSHCQYR